MLNLFAVGGKKVQDVFGRLRRLFGRHIHTIEKELQPLLPLSMGANTLQAFVVSVAMCFEIQAQIQEGLVERTLCAQ